MNINRKIRALMIEGLALVALLAFALVPSIVLAEETSPRTVNTPASLDIEPPFDAELDFTFDPAPAEDVTVTFSYDTSILEVMPMTPTFAAGSLAGMVDVSAAEMAPVTETTLEYALSSADDVYDGLTGSVNVSILDTAVSECFDTESYSADGVFNPVATNGATAQVIDLPEAFEDDCDSALVIFGGDDGSGSSVAGARSPIPVGGGDAMVRDLTGGQGDTLTLTFKRGAINATASGDAGVIGARILLFNGGDGGTLVDFGQCVEVIAPGTPLSTGTISEFTAQECSVTATGDYDTVVLLVGTYRVTGGIVAIDEVSLTTEAAPTIAEVVVGNPDFSTLLAALQTANLVGNFDEATDGPLTVFAPTDAAFADFLAEEGLTAAELLASPGLADVLLYHVVDGNVPSSALSDGQVVTTLQGGTFTVNISGGTVTLTDAEGTDTITVTTTDIYASNGIIHVIDTVLEPPATP